MNAEYVVRLAKRFAANVRETISREAFEDLLERNGKQTAADRSCLVREYCSEDMCMAAAWDAICPNVNTANTAGRRLWHAGIRCATLNNFFVGVPRG